MLFRLLKEFCWRIRVTRATTWKFVPAFTFLLYPNLRTCWRQGNPFSYNLIYDFQIIQTANKYIALMGVANSNPIDVRVGTYNVLIFDEPVFDETRFYISPIWGMKNFIVAKSSLSNFPHEQYNRLWSILCILHNKRAMQISVRCTILRKIGACSANKKIIWGVWRMVGMVSSLRPWWIRKSKGVYYRSNLYSKALNKKQKT